MPPEGSLFTDTLNFTRGTTRSEIIDRMVASQKKLVDEAWAKRNPDLPVKDKNEFVTLASIVERKPASRRNVRMLPRSSSIV